jgi:hypothetical protein
VIVNGRTAVFVARTKHVLVARDPLPITPQYKISGILAIWLGSDKHIFAVLLAHF